MTGAALPYHGAAALADTADASPRGSHGRLRRSDLRAVGELVGVIYRTDRHSPGRHRTYIHVMRERPTLACDVAGRQLHIVGGSYRITKRGIEG